MLDTSLFDEEGFADRATLDRFHHESLTLVAKRHLRPYDGEESLMTEEEIREQEANPIPDAIAFQERRLCEDRCEYVGNPPVEDLPTDLLELELPPYDPLLEDDENRKLGIYGADTRKKVTDTSLYPNRVAGQLQYASGGHCSGTVIYSHAVLTAGHCVHEGRLGGAWLDHSTFTPARYRSITGGLTDRYGKFSVRTMRTYNGWTQSGNTVYDIAVVIYFPRPSDGLSLGRSVGYAGLRYTLWNSATLNFCSIRGYPGDKLFGEMWTTGLCSPGYQQALNALRVRHFCDTTAGMSGSSLMTDDGFVSGAHTTAITSVATGMLLYNEASLLNGIHWQRVLEWSGRPLQA
jgi:V8-like Glu-specific endopeptidase